MNENRELVPLESYVISSCMFSMRVLTKTLACGYGLFMMCAVFYLKGVLSRPSQKPNFQGQVLFFCNVAVMTRYFELSRFKSMYFDHTWRAQCLVILYYYCLFIVFFFSFGLSIHHVHLTWFLIEPSACAVFSQT